MAEGQQGGLSAKYVKGKEAAIALGVQATRLLFAQHSVLHTHSNNGDAHLFAHGRRTLALSLQQRSLKV